MASLSPLIRLINLQPSELPSHPALASTDSPSTKRPDLASFILALFEQTDQMLDPEQFGVTFKSHSHRPSPPSNTDVESLTWTVPASDINPINWADPAATGGVGRTKPRDVSTEHWCARRSYHQNISSKVNPATASWDEFVFGLRDEHSKHEHDFTPTLYDAKHILDWNQELRAVAEKWKVEREQFEGGAGKPYTNMTLAVYEMCHEIPFPLQPRCFPVLVATASTSSARFIAATVPVNLGSFEGAFYSNGRNRTEGSDSLQKKQVVVGMYTAVEKCELFSKETTTEDGRTEKDEKIEWVMATASDAKGNVPMAIQKTSMPSQVAKDVGYFLKWISGVDQEVIDGKRPVSEVPVAGKSTENKENRGLSSAR